MTVKNAFTKLEKNGFSISKKGNFFCASKLNSRYLIEFLKNGGGSDSITCITVRREDDHTDLMTDYFAGTWCKNLTYAIKFAERCHTPI